MSVTILRSRSNSALVNGATVDSIFRGLRTKNVSHVNAQQNSHGNTLQSHSNAQTMIPTQTAAPPTVPQPSAMESSHAAAAGSVNLLDSSAASTSTSSHLAQHTTPQSLPMAPAATCASMEPSLSVEAAPSVQMSSESDKSEKSKVASKTGEEEDEEKTHSRSGTAVSLSLVQSMHEEHEGSRDGGSIKAQILPKSTAAEHFNERKLSDEREKPSLLKALDEAALHQKLNNGPQRRRLPSLTTGSTRTLLVCEAPNGAGDAVEFAPPSPLSAPPQCSLSRPPQKSVSNSELSQLLQTHPSHQPASRSSFSSKANDALLLSALPKAPLAPLRNENSSPNLGVLSSDSNPPRSRSFSSGSDSDTRVGVILSTSLSEQLAKADMPATFAKDSFALQSRHHRRRPSLPALFPQDSSQAASGSGLARSPSCSTLPAGAAAVKRMNSSALPPEHQTHSRSASAAPAANVASVLAALPPSPSHATQTSSLRGNAVLYALNDDASSASSSSVLPRQPPSPSALDLHSKASKSSGGEQKVSIMRSPRDYLPAIRNSKTPEASHRERRRSFSANHEASSPKSPIDSNTAAQSGSTLGLHLDNANHPNVTSNVNISSQSATSAAASQLSSSTSSSVVNESHLSRRRFSMADIGQPPVHQQLPTAMALQRAQKALKMLGVTETQAKRWKAMKLLGIDEFQLEHGSASAMPQNEQAESSTQVADSDTTSSHNRALHSLPPFRPQTDMPNRMLVQSTTETISESVISNSGAGIASSSSSSSSAMNRQGRPQARCRRGAKTYSKSNID